jgi:hypothetical protein
MRTGSRSTWASRAPRLQVGGLRRASCLATFTLLATLGGATSASAKTEQPTVYTLTVVEGETTLPEEPIVQTSASVSTEAKSKPVVQVSINRGGTVIARSNDLEHPEYAGASMPQVPQVGDLLTLESPINTPIGSFVYDGLPTMDPTVCAGSANFSGQNSSGQTVKGSYMTLKLDIERYSSHVESVNPGHAQVTSLSGTTFGGSFLAPLTLGETVSATESLETPLAGNAVFKYVSENERPVGACPPVVVPTPPPSPPPALEGSLLKFATTTILKLLKSGWRDHVTINLPGTVTQDLYLEDGTLPAVAASKHHAKPPALLLARGVATATSPGTVSVLLKLTSKGRHTLKSAHGARVVLITTLRANSGTKLTLPRRTVTLHR